MSTRADTLSTIVEMHSAKKIDGYLVDVLTASMLLKVYGALSPTNREKFDSIPLPRLVDFGWKHVRAA